MVSKWRDQGDGSWASTGNNSWGWIHREVKGYFSKSFLELTFCLSCLNVLVLERRDMMISEDTLVVLCSLQHPAHTLSPPTPNSYTVPSSTPHIHHPLQHPTYTLSLPTHILSSPTSNSYTVPSNTQLYIALSNTPQYTVSSNSPPISHYTLSPPTHTLSLPIPHNTPSSPITTDTVFSDTPYKHCSSNTLTQTHAYSGKWWRNGQEK